MGNEIYPLAYELEPAQTRILYYLGFPAHWKSVLFEINRTLNPWSKEEYGLQTNPLKRMILSWMDGVIDLAPVKQGSDDSHWLTSCSPYTDQDLQTLCQLIEVWCRVTFEQHKQASAEIKKQVNEFCCLLDWKELKALQTQKSICLTFPDGTVSSEAYPAIPLLAVNQLLGKEISLHGIPLKLYYAGKNELISQPIQDPKSKHQYSFAFNFSVQTTPPDRHALLLCHLCIHRWIYASTKTNDTLPFLKNAIFAHIKVNANKYCQVSISYDPAKKSVDWNEQDKTCYNICGFETLPPVSDILLHPEQYTSSILLPYKNGMGSFTASKIGTGVPVSDKADLYEAIKGLLDGFVKPENPQVERFRRPPNLGLHTLCSPQEYPSHEAFRQWVRSCAETDEIVFELYGLWKDEKQCSLLSKIEQKIWRDFGPNQPGSCLKISCERKEIQDLVNSLENSTRQVQIRHCKKAQQLLGPAHGVVGSLVLIPHADFYTNDQSGDPKQALRNAFALTGRVVQFINPTLENKSPQKQKTGQPEDPSKKDGETAKIENCVYDLYRQLGIVSLIDFSKKNSPLLSVPCVGFHICTQIHGKNQIGHTLPISVVAELQSGKVRVHCDVFSKPTVSYREACLEMAQLFWNDKLDSFCSDASLQPAKQTLLELKNLYQSPDEPILLLITSDKNTRSLWSGISDTEIGEYVSIEDYCPKQINAGKKRSPFYLSLTNSGVRIMRIRSNQEVPDYYTPLSSKSTSENQQRAATAGIFQYGQTFWSIIPRPNDIKYTRTLKETRIDHPKSSYAEKDMIEFYPIQQQPGDQIAEWLFYANALRELPLQYNQATSLPLPLHLAKGLEEYLFDA